MKKPVEVTLLHLQGFCQRHTFGADKSFPNREPDGKGFSKRASNYHS